MAILQSQNICIVLELLLKESVARFFPSLGFPRIKILVSLVHGVDVILF